MPGSVQLAAPVTVMPFSLCSAFSERRRFLTRRNDYAGGESCRAQQSVHSRLAWVQTKHLTITQWNDLWDFYIDRGGNLEPFYWYPNKSQYDPTGVSTVGRITVRFDSPLNRTFGQPREEINLSLIQVA